MNWADPSLVFPSFVPSACEGLGLGREEATSGTAWIFAREGRRNWEPRNQEVGSLHRMQEGRKKHWEKNSAYLRARPTWVFWLNLEVTFFLLEFLLQMWRGESCTHSYWVTGRVTASPGALWFHSHCGYHPKAESKCKVIQKMTYFKYYLKYYKICQSVLAYQVSWVFFFSRDDSSA